MYRTVSPPTQERTIPHCTVQTLPHPNATHATTTARDALTMRPGVARSIARRAAIPNPRAAIRPRGPLRSLATTSKSENESESENSEPFYGSPRSTTGPLGIADRIGIALRSATTALSDPTRADAVAALGEVTGDFTLRRIRDRMEADPTGRRILRERPVVTKATIPYERLVAEAPDRFGGNGGEDDDGLTFGQVYGSFLKEHGFDPDERDDVRFVEDDTLAYVMLRYRQNHDFFHAITGLPPTVLGELGLKWLELFQTGLPVAALSCTVGSLRLDPRERDVLANSYLPWAASHGSHRAAVATRGGGQHVAQPPPPFLMNVYYEKEFDTPIGALRRKLGLAPAPALRE